MLLLYPALRPISGDFACSRAESWGRETISSGAERPGFPVRSLDGCVMIPKRGFCMSSFQAVQGLNGMLGNGHADTLVCQRGLASVTWLMSCYGCHIHVARPTFVVKTDLRSSIVMANWKRRRLPTNVVTPVPWVTVPGSSLWRSWFSLSLKSETCSIQWSFINISYSYTNKSIRNTSNDWDPWDITYQNATKVVD